MGRAALQTPGRADTQRPSVPVGQDAWDGRAPGWVCLAWAAGRWAPQRTLPADRSPQGEDFCSSRQATCSSYGPKVSGLRQLIMRAPGSGQLGSVGGSCSGSHTAATTGRVDLVSSPSFLVLGWHGGTCGGWAGISLCMQPLHGAFQRLAVSRWSDFLQITSSRLYSSSSYGAHPHSRRGVVGPTDFACLC